VDKAELSIHAKLLADVIDVFSVLVDPAVVPNIGSPAAGELRPFWSWPRSPPLVPGTSTERRDVILNDPECLSGLRQILETFVAVGSDRAIRRVQDLGELFT
jgi:hypothetical protein